MAEPDNAELFNNAELLNNAEFFDNAEVTQSPATDFSVALLSEFVRLGVRHVVLSPGSRSQSLALVAAELERVGAIRLHVRIDERVAGFLALGLAVESTLPALVITTSGTATANLHPAVLEAHHSGVPMIVLTADRPTELRGIRANQTTNQPSMYGTAVRLSVDVPAPVGDAAEADAAASLAADAWAAALGIRASGARAAGPAPGPATAPAPGPGPGPAPGPVQLNLAFREPLSSEVPDLRQLLASAPVEVAQKPATGAVGEAETLDPGIRTVVIAGHGAGAEAEALARSGGWPLLAEVSSGARFGPQLVVAYRELLADDDFGGRVERAIVFGHPTLSREVPALLHRADVETIVVAPHDGEYYNPGHRARAVAAVRVSTETDPSARQARDWAGRWVFASRALVDAVTAGDADLTAPDVEAGRSHEPSERLAFARAELAAVRAPITRRMLAEALWRFTWPHDRLVLAASRLIRDADRSVPGKNIRVHANRGLAGIDGTISTAVGIALAAATEAAASGVTRVLLGDLALLHDAGALLLGAGEERPRIQLVVGNDNGGTIFDGLEVAFSAPHEAFDRVMLTRQNVDIASLAAAYGWQYARATTRGELDQALSGPIDGPSVLEVPLPR
jgi:2-succinyl-5-enolpyruvyl-6-hydroxy-3-cyclohexene-1-carboxylate synthase